MMRDVIDCKEIEPLFEDFFRVLQRGKHLESYRVMDDWVDNLLPFTYNANRCNSNF